MYSLETSIQVNQVSFNIRNQGDYRVVLDCFEALNDTELTDIERLYAALIIFYEDFSDPEDFPDRETLDKLIRAMFDFFNQHEDLQSNTQNVKVIDWETDSNLISSAINKVANQEIRSLSYLHWWTFLGYYMAIGECLLSTVVSIRYKLLKHEKLEKYEKKFKQDNPQYFNIDLRTTEQKEADEYIRQLWGDD
jgi:hypothetical protein